MKTLLKIEGKIRYNIVQSYWAKFINTDVEKRVGVVDYIKTLDTHITTAYSSQDKGFYVVFDCEEHLNWFVLKWS